MPEKAAPEPEPAPDELQPLASDGKWSNAQLAIARAWLADNWASYSCPFHGLTEWTIDSYAAVVPAGSPFGGRVFTFVVVACKTCAWSAFLNAINIGMIPRDAPAATSSDDRPAETPTEPETD